LAVASDGNGLILVPVGLLMLVPGRHYARLAGWLAVSAGCLAAYAYRYNIMSSQVDARHSVFQSFHPLSSLYGLAFLGSAGSIPFPPGCFLLGSLLCIFFACMARRGYVRRNPRVSCCVLFVLLTAIGVAGLRSEFGVAQSLSSRYTIYSALFLIFAWFALVEEFLPRRRGSLLNNNIFLGAATAAVLFFLFMSTIGSLQLERRNRELVLAMAAFEHPASAQPAVGPALLLPAREAGAEAYNQRVAFNLGARAILIQSMKLGVYRPPLLPRPECFHRGDFENEPLRASPGCD
jgi:hypothetical protein